MNDVNPALIARLQARAEFGIAKYGVPLTPWNGRNPLEDQEEELLDRWVYIQQDKMEREDTAALLFEVSNKLADALFALGKVSDDDWEFIGKCHAIVSRLRADVPRIGVPATRVLSGGPMARLEAMDGNEGVRSVLS